MNERRIHPRLNLPLESHYSLDGSDLEQVATMLDLSAGGAGLQLPRELPIGTQLDFRFVLPPDGGRSGMPILARAEVARTEKLETEDEDLGFLTGLRFVELGADSFQRIQQFVFAHLTKGQPQPEEMPLERRRVEIKSPISIRFDRFDDFENEVSGDLSLSGMFIRSDHPKPPGTIFTFEYQLDDFPLVSGRAEVVWTRIRSQGPGMVPGMGVRFLDLDDSSRNVIRRLVESKLQEGETSLVAEDRRVAGRSKPHRISRPLKRPEPPEEETETEIDKLRRELARRTKEFSDQEERLKQQIMDLTNREVEHQDRLRTSEHSLRTAATRAQEQEERLAEQERRLVDAGYEQEGLSARLREVSGARESLAVELEALAVTRHDEQAALQAHLEAATAGEADRLRRIEELEGENAAAHRRLEDLEYRETELRKDNEELRGELERVRQALRTTTEDAEREAGSQADWAREVEARQAEIEVLQSDLGQSLEAGRDAEKLLLAELGSARTDYERLEAELHSARSRGSESEATESVLRERLDAALSEVERERENSEKTENELRTELLRAIAQADKMAADGAELGAAVRESESEHHETVQALEAANRGLNAKIARLEEVEPREPQPPTAELLLEPVVPIVEPDIQPDRPDRRWSRIAAVALLGVVAAAAVFLSPMGERLRSAVPSFRAEVVPVATQSVTTDTQQAARRERLGGSEPQLEAGTEPEITTARRESAKEAIAIAETAVLEPGPEISVGLEDEPIGEPAVVVGHWARAWSEQRVEDYLGFYTADFVPANGMSRSEWEAYRRDRLTAPRSISVSLDEIRQETVGEDRVEVVFAQSYNADSYSDRVRKTLLLALETDGWRIAGETAEPIP